LIGTIVTDGTGQITLSPPAESPITSGRS